MENYNKMKRNKKAQKHSEAMKEYWKKRRENTIEETGNTNLFLEGFKAGIVFALQKLK